MSIILLVVAILCFLIAAITAHENTELIVRAVVWGYVGLAAFAAAHLPVGDWVARSRA